MFIIIIFWYTTNLCNRTDLTNYSCVTLSFENFPHEKLWAMNRIFHPLSHHETHEKELEKKTNSKWFQITSIFFSSVFCTKTVNCIVFVHNRNISLTLDIFHTTTHRHTHTHSYTRAYRMLWYAMMRELSYITVLKHSTKIWE